MHRPRDFRNSAITLLALWAVGCEHATEPPPPPPAAALLLTAVTATTLTGTVGTELVPAPVVRATDADGRAMAGMSVTFLVGKDGGEITTTAATTDENGLASVGRWMLGPIAKAQTVAARVAGVDDVIFTAAAVAGPVAKLQALSGMNQMAWPGWPVGTVLRVRVADAFGNPIASAPVAFTVTAGGGSIASAPAITDTAGVAASGVWTLGPDSGEQQVRATSGTVSATFTATAIMIRPSSGLQSRLAFVSVVDGNADIYTMNADGTGVERLTTDPGRDLQPVWTPSGAQITFVAARNDQAGIYIMDADGSNIVGLTPDQAYSVDPSWSPDLDGTALAYTSLREESPGSGRSADVVSLDTRTGVVSVLAASPGYDGQPSWSPDERRLAFVSDREAYDFALDIFTLNADGTGLVRLTQSFDLGERGMRYYQHPTWSPDGSLIAFVWGEFLGSPEDVRFHVAVMAPDGSGVRDLAWAGDINWYHLLDPGSLAWSPDGRGIAFSFANCGESAGAECTRSVKYVPVVGGTVVTLVPNGHSPSWR